MSLCGGVTLTRERGQAVTDMLLGNTEHMVDGDLNSHGVGSLQGSKKLLCESFQLFRGDLVLVTALARLTSCLTRVHSQEGEAGGLLIMPISSPSKPAVSNT